MWCVLKCSEACAENRTGGAGMNEEERGEAKKRGVEGGDLLLIK